MKKQKTFKIVLQQTVIAHAKDLETAVSLIQKDPPYRCVWGCGTKEGSYDYETREEIEIISVNGKEVPKSESIIQAPGRTNRNKKILLIDAQNDFIKEDSYSALTTAQAHKVTGLAAGALKKHASKLLWPRHCKRGGSK